MARDKLMERYAQDCIRLARLAPDVGIQEELMKMAVDWTAAAAGSKQQQTTSHARHQSTPTTSVDTPRSRHVAGGGAKKHLREPSGRLQRQKPPSGDGCASVKGTRSVVAAFGRGDLLGRDHEAVPSPQHHSPDEHQKSRLAARLVK